MEWVSVKDGLPEVGSWVNASDGKIVSMFKMSRYRKNNLRWEWYGSVYHPWTVTHWMPLPEPPKDQQ